MSWLLYLPLKRVCTNCKSSFTPTLRSYSSLWTPQARCKTRLSKQSFVRQRRQFFVRQSVTIYKSRFWIFGIGTGIILGLGLKCHIDFNESSCEYIINNDMGRKSGRYLPAIQVSRDLARRIKVGQQDEVGAPGLVVGVSVDGTQVWCEGLGYADLENRVPCSPETVLRIASISKPLTTAAAARLCEEGKLDLDAPVQKYVPEFPQKQFEGEDVTITPRMILSHLSGIRHYEKDIKKVREDREKARRPLKQPDKEEKSTKENTEDTKTEASCTKQNQKKKEFEQEEYYLKDGFDSVIQALDLFKYDPLVFKPGTTFLYSTHAFTLLSAVVERAAGQRFLDHMMKMFRELGMLNTVPDENDPIIYNRSRFYHFSKKGRIVNCPYVDNSYKWAGGGFLSTVGDLLIFGNALLYSFQLAQLKDTSGLLPGILQPQTATALWAPVEKTEASWDKDGLYAHGWLVVEKLQKYGLCRRRRHYVSHTGGAVGASSVLLILPSEPMSEIAERQRAALPQGVVVTIITNMQSVGLNSTALKIAHEFDKARGV
ncbi:serine beta-lactamase-like protein LACTB, mitochondrial isoform X1 [Hypomesus transpacificus]|uniref:serine beta-lactamase-like protein LACTB, mitochondrial isoform X1 n=2 Tax=Hypomesus transpacificus TaxID=137520 RepID=UPI001F0734BD|nr:serine beta-lactamase-like protein LACTB, mitochondrial isoform X1 [Hypomesus transpacificus]XP_046890113.1 serine beta-lactamase-like protein LACTB, mitochondrial isoform X1 [Hypomesus transpacificus]